jgi:O-antigen ligase
VFAVLLMVIPSAQRISGIAISPATAIGIVALLWWAIEKTLPDSALARGYQPVRVVLGIYVLVVLVSYIGGFTHFLQSDEVRSADRAVITLAAFSGVVLLAADGIQNYRRLDALLRRFTGLAIALAVLGITQFYTGIEITPLFEIPGLRSASELSFIGQRAALRRVAGTAAHPIEFGVILAIMLPIALHYAMNSADKRSRHHWLLGSAILGAGIMMSLSRSAILGALAALIVVALTWDWRRIVNGVVALTLFTLAMRVTTPGLIGALRNLFVNIRSDTSYQARTARYPAAFHLIHENPWFGRGVGTLLPAHFFGVVPLDNQYLSSAIEIGVVGLAAVLLLIIVGIFTARGARRRSLDPEARSLAQALAGSLAACLISFETFDAFAFPKVLFGFALVLGTTGALWRMARAHAT